MTKYKFDKHQLKATSELQATTLDRHIQNSIFFSNKQSASLSTRQMPQTI